MSKCIGIQQIGLAMGLAAASCAIGGCALPGQRSTPDSEVAATAPEPPTQAGPTNVQAVELASADGQGQTSWRIKPEVSVLPPVKGDKHSVPPHIESRMQYAFDLAQRGATYSAYSEFQSVLGLCAAELDAAEGKSARRTAIQEGFVAMEEAQDFSATPSQLSSGQIDVVRISASHRTPLQEQIKAESWTVEQATQAYYEFAMNRIAAACRGATAAPNALYGMGRTSALLDDSQSHGTLRALLLYSLALQLQPTHALAANELGVLLAQNGRLQEAEQALQQAAAIDGSRETWANLAVVYSRLGKVEESQLAQQRSQNRGNQDASSGKMQVPEGATELAAATDAKQHELLNAGDVSESSAKPAGQSLAAEGIKQNILGIFRR